MIALIAVATRAEDGKPSPDEAAIRKNVQASVEAFNRHDAKAMAALWSPEAVYVNRTSGERVVGRAEIEKQYAAQFEADAKSKLAIDVDAIDFVSPNVAIERGTAKVINGDEPASELDYSAVHVKRDGVWLLDRVTEDEIVPVISNYEHLKDLEWMVGTWVDNDPDAGVQVTTECQWAKNQNFMTRAFSIALGDDISMSGMQIIGWDPSEKKIRSWVFDSDGGFGEGEWQRKDNRWFIKQVGVLPDGGQSSQINVMTKLDDNTFTWQSINREIDGVVQPNTDEIVVVRAAD
jgi:uncharacterized protein (TIGR02246 family)